MKYLLIFLMGLTLSCGSSSETVAEVDTPEDVEHPDQAEMYCADIIELSDLPDSLVMAEATVLSLKKVKGCVCIKYQYSGCRKGQTLLAYDGEFQESNRPEVDMMLGVANAGLCEQLLTDSACFSMKKMQLIGNQVLIYINGKENNILLNYNDPKKD